MRIESDYFDYIEKLENRRIIVQSLLIDLGKLGALIHPIRTVRLKMEERQINKIDNDITRITFDLNNSKPGYSSDMLEDTMNFYIRSHPITEKGVSLRRKPILVSKTRN